MSKPNDYQNKKQLYYPRVCLQQRGIYLSRNAIRFIGYFIQDARIFEITDMAFRSAPLSVVYPLMICFEKPLLFFWC